jgi:succinate dehydrogenase / fumarate reductase membrane anchor subunit
MVANVTSFSRSGLSDFIVQRVTAVVLAIYTLCVVGWFIANPGADHAAISGYFGSGAMKAFTTLAVLSTAAHAWIGMWTVGTDYIRGHYFGGIATTARLVYQAGVMAGLFIYTLWGIEVIWRL